ncbi:MAG: hypothetical protein WBD00_03635 [Candidatus Omnitrophota bacterium]
MNGRITFLRNQKGLMMITAYMIIAAMSVFAAAAIKMATTEYNFARRYFLSTKTYYLAEAAAEEVAFDLADKIASETEPTYDPETPTRWEDLCLDVSDYLSTGYNMKSVCVVIDEDHQSVTSTARERHYQLSATVTDPETGVTSTINYLVLRRKTYVFQHAIFYADDLEVLPGSNMTLSGDIHSNLDIYMSTSATLRIDADHVNAAGNIYNRRKDSNNTDGGIVEMLKMGTDDTFRHMKYWWETSPLDSRRSDWGASSLSRWGDGLNGTVKSGVHGITAKAVADIYSIQPDGYYATSADVKAVNGELYDGGTTLTEVAYADHNEDGSINASDFGPNDIPEGTINTTTTFYNYRERKYIKMTDIDIRKLSGYVQGVDGEGNPLVDGEGNPVYVQHYSSHLPSNGLMYATRNDAESFEQPGIRVVNGAQIDNASGLTLVTNDPAYIQGDFNAVNKKPVAVISDALNIVSNNWSDANSDMGLNDRLAVNTEVNAAFISGADATSGSTYGGGLENYPRLHENWSGDVLTIRGSFVNLWDCQIAEGSWGQSSYNAPVRNWDYDSDFSDVADLPGFTPQVVGVEKVASWSGDYSSIYSEEYSTVP